jgi:isopenicillin-N epimerase
VAVQSAGERVPVRAARGAAPAGAAGSELGGWNRDEPDPKGLANPWGLSRFVLENEWQGTRDPAAYLSVPAAIQFQAEHDWPRVRSQCHELLRETRRRIEELTGLPAICPDTDPKGFGNPSVLYAWYAQMAAFPLPPCDAGALQRRLYEEYRIEVPIIEWGGRQSMRVSLQGCNTPEDVEALLGALEALLVQVRP